MGRASGKSHAVAAGANRRSTGQPSRVAKDVILDAIRGNDTVELRGAKDPENRYMACFILDDDTQPYRELETFHSQADVAYALAYPPEGFVGEYAIDLHADANACVYESLDPSIGTAIFDGPAKPFDEDNVAFAIG